MVIHILKVLLVPIKFILVFSSHVCQILELDGALLELAEEQFLWEDLRHCEDQFHCFKELGVAPADHWLLLLGALGDDVEQLLGLILNRASADHKAKHLKRKDIHLKSVEGAPLSAISARHLVVVAGILVVENSPGFPDLLLFRVIRFHFSLDLLMRFDKHSLHLHHFQKWAFRICHLNDPIWIVFEEFHKFCEWNVLDIVVDHTCALTSSDSIELCQEIFNFHQVHWTRCMSIKLAKLIKFSAIFLDKVIMELKIMIHAICIVANVKSNFCIEISGAAATFVAHSYL